ncbi:NUDIX hydrolase [Modestobacter sp. I12A-02662]|uniref:NUDIX hydrolase n=1 Tax=Modestobacter sp. I12A-02662 TaxID=1730496 RepID=UPI0034E03CF1
MMSCEKSLLKGARLITMPEHELRMWLEAQTWPDLRARLEGTTDLVAYDHPYGFVVCRLREDEIEGWQIRLHLWPSRGEMERVMARRGTLDQQVHAHGWRILSTVLIGSIEESRYVVSPCESSETSLYRVESDYGSGTSRLALEAPAVGVRLASRSERGAHSGVIEIPRGEYHSSASLVAPSLTLVATELRGGSSFVVAPKGLGPMIVNARRPVLDLAEQFAYFDEQYSAGVGDKWAAFVFIVDDSSGKVLLVRSSRRPELWQPVGGRQEPGDLSPIRTVVREVDEEVGLSIAPDSLHPLLQQPRDVGDGKVFFWLTTVSDVSSLRLQESEILEARWVDVGDLGAYPMYQGSLVALPHLFGAMQRRTSN